MCSKIAQERKINFSCSLVFMRIEAIKHCWKYEGRRRKEEGNLKCGGRQMNFNVGTCNDRGFDDDNGDNVKTIKELFVEMMDESE
jgi:hypothetical protein